MAQYNPKSIEKKWQEAWEDAKVFQAKQIIKNQNIMCLKCFPIPPAGFTWDTLEIIQWETL